MRKGRFEGKIVYAMHIIFITYIMLSYDMLVYMCIVVHDSLRVCMFLFVSVMGM